MLSAIGERERRDAHLLDAPTIHRDHLEPEALPVHRVAGAREAAQLGASLASDLLRRDQIGL
jgi:hypothetical protein